MADARFRAKAREDLESIWDYTADRWGVVQADRYVANLIRTADHLVQYPDSGRPYDMIHKGLRAYPSGKHLMFYFQMAEGIEVLRVLHERMDVGLHLSE